MPSSVFCNACLCLQADVSVSWAVTFHKCHGKHLKFFPQNIYKMQTSRVDGISTGVACCSPRFVTNLCHAHISLTVRWPSWPTVPPGSWATPILHHHILTRFFRCDWAWLKVETILDVTQKKVWVLDTYQLTVLVRCLGFFLIWFTYIYIYKYIIHIKPRVTQCVLRWNPRAQNHPILRAPEEEWCSEIVRVSGGPQFLVGFFGQNRCCL